MCDWCCQPFQPKGLVELASVKQLNEIMRRELKSMSEDMINHPPHYNNGKAHCTCGRKIECIDITRHMGFNIGNALKYIWRADHKGKPVEDLKKAIWYLQDEINHREAQNE